MLTYKDDVLTVRELDPTVPVTGPELLPNLCIPALTPSGRRYVHFHAVNVEGQGRVPDPRAREKSISQFHAALKARYVELGYNENSVDTLQMHGYGFWEKITPETGTITFFSKSRNHRVRGRGLFNGTVDFDLTQAGAEQNSDGAAGSIVSSEGVHSVIIRLHPQVFDVPNEPILEWIRNELNNIPAWNVS